MNKYDKELKKLLAKDKLALMKADLFYKRFSEKEKQKRFEEHGLPDYCYIDNSMLHLIQPLLKCQYENYIPKKILDKRQRYAIKVSMKKEGLIFIMNSKSVEYVLLNPFEKFDLKELPILDPDLINEICSFHVFYEICKELGCETIERYWGFIKTLAIKYDFYPKRIFSQKNEDLSYPQPGFCLYSGEPIKEGYFKDPKAKSDFFNKRYFEDGLFGNNVLNYAKRVEEVIRKELKNNEKEALDYFKRIQKKARSYDPKKHKLPAKVSMELIEEFKNQITEDGLKEMASSKASVKPIKVDTLISANHNCAKYLIKKINGISHKYGNKKLQGDVLTDNLIKMIGKYYLKNRFKQDFDFLDVLLLMPAFHPKTSTQVFKSGKIFEELVYECLSKVKPSFLKENSSDKDFYQEIIQNRPIHSKSKTKLTKPKLKEFISKGISDPTSYPKVLYIYKTSKMIELNDKLQEYNKAMNKSYEVPSQALSYYDEYLEVSFEENLFIDTLNSLLKLTTPMDSGSNTSRIKQINLQIFRFYKKDLIHALKKCLISRLK